jgi:hypothetical protein
VVGPAEARKRRKNTGGGRGGGGRYGGGKKRRGWRAEQRRAQASHHNIGWGHSTWHGGLAALDVSEKRFCSSQAQRAVNSFMLYEILKHRCACVRVQ